MYEHFDRWGLTVWNIRPVFRLKEGWQYTEAFSLRDKKTTAGGGLLSE